jgi:triacylglycerol lipase
VFGGRFRLSLIGASVLVAVVAGVLAFGGEAEAQASDGAFLAREGTPPPGANVRCRPTRAHPYPVVLVHGTFETMDQNWSVVSPRLKREGYCVFALNYGNRGLGPIGESSRELGRFVENVMRFTGAKKVSLVGHSQGGMMPRRWIKGQDTGNMVDDLVGFAPSNYGTTVNSFGPSGPCTACAQQNAGSRFIRMLNRGDDTLGNASYTQIATDDDEIIVPYTNCFLRGERRTANLTLQDYYEPDIVVTHQNIYDDPIAQELMLDALDNPGPARAGRALADFPLP